MMILFFISLLVLVYIYIGYPVLIMLVGCLMRRTVRTEPITPLVSILIAAHNEDTYIRATLENKITLDYPNEKREIIVISDGSSDATDSIVREYESRGIIFLRQEPQQGKTAALNMAVKLAKGEILVFSDANSIYAPQALRHLVASFADPSVGYVTGRLIYVDSPSLSPDQGTPLYMRFENALRLAETLVGSVVGVNGGIDAVRLSLYTAMRADQLPDFVLPLRVIEQGYRVVYNPAAISFEDALGNLKDEYRMRVRVSLRALHGIADMAHLLNVWRFGLFSWQLLSHKLLRYVAFLPLGILYFSSLFLVPEGLGYTLVFLFQTLVYVLAGLSYLLLRSPDSLPIRLAHYFVLLNVAAAYATFLWLRAETRVVWNPRTG